MTMRGRMKFKRSADLIQKPLDVDDGPEEYKVYNVSMTRLSEVVCRDGCAPWPTSTYMVHVHNAFAV